MKLDKNPGKEAIKLDKNPGKETRNLEKRQNVKRDLTWKRSNEAGKETEPGIETKDLQKI